MAVATFGEPLGWGIMPSHGERSELGPKVRGALLRLAITVAIVAHTGDKVTNKNKMSTAGIRLAMLAKRLAQASRRLFWDGPRPATSLNWTSKRLSIRFGPIMRSYSRPTPCQRRGHGSKSSGVELLRPLGRCKISAGRWHSRAADAAWHSRRRFAP
jgi:hypothetical protein